MKSRVLEKGSSTHNNKPKVDELFLFLKNLSERWLHAYSVQTTKSYSAIHFNKSLTGLTEAS